VAHDDVGDHRQAVGGKGRLEQDLEARLGQCGPAALKSAGPAGRVLDAEVLAAAVFSDREGARDFADPVAGGEDGLGLRIDLLEIGAVDRQPQAPVALQRGDELGLAY
jgi:hypothetical protein